MKLLLDLVPFFIAGGIVAIAWQLTERAIERIFPKKKRALKVVVEHKIVPSGVDGCVDVTLSIRNAALKIEAAMQKGVDGANG